MEHLVFDKRDSDGYCAAHYCVKYGNLTLLKELCAAGADMKRKTKPSDETQPTKTLMALAEEKGNKDIVTFLEKIYQKRKSRASIGVGFAAMRRRSASAPDGLEFE